MTIAKLVSGWLLSMQAWVQLWGNVGFMVN